MSYRYSNRSSGAGGYSSGMGGYSSSGMGGYASGRGNDYYSGQGASRARSYASYGGSGDLGGRDGSAGYGRMGSGTGYGLSQAGMGGAEPGSSSSDEDKSAPAPAAIAPTSLQQAIAGAHKDATGLRKNVTNAQDMLAKHKLPEHVHKMLEALGDHAHAVEARLKDMTEQAEQKAAQERGAPPTTSRAVAAHSLGGSCARCGYSAQSSRY